MITNTPAFNDPTMPFNLDKSPFHLIFHFNMSLVHRDTTLINYHFSHASNKVCNVIYAREFVAKPITTETFASSLELLNASSLYFRLVFSAILMSMSIVVVVVLAIKTVLMSSIHSLRGDQQ